MHVCSSSSERGLPVGLRARVGGARGRGVRGTLGCRACADGLVSHRNEGLRLVGFCETRADPRAASCPRDALPQQGHRSLPAQPHPPRAMHFTWLSKRRVFAAAIT